MRILLAGDTHGNASPLWQVELPACHENRQRLARVMDGVEPSVVVHGHYHRSYRRVLDTAWGAVEVVGLSEDGTVGKLALLECRAGGWSLEPVNLFEVLGAANR